MRVSQENKADRGRPVSAEGRGREGTCARRAVPGHRSRRARRAPRAKRFTHAAGQSAQAAVWTVSGARAVTDAKGGKARNSPVAELGPRAAALSLSPLSHAALWWPVVAEAAAPWEEAADSRTRAAKAQASGTPAVRGSDQAQKDAGASVT